MLFIYFEIHDHFKAFFSRDSEKVKIHYFPLFSLYAYDSKKELVQNVNILFQKVIGAF
jgi:hypothetical protein